MDRNKMVRVVNRGTGPVGYSIPEMGVRRQFQPREEKQISMGELEQLSYIPGGKTLMDKYFVLRDKAALAYFYPKNVEPEYFYDIKDIKRMLTTASYDEFLDFLDFANDGCIDILEDMAVKMELNDLRKREAIQKKTGLNITEAIRVKNTKYDGDTGNTSDAENPNVKKRRVQAGAPQVEATSSPRRTVAQAGGFVIPD